MKIIRMAVIGLIFGDFTIVASAQQVAAPGSFTFQGGSPAQSGSQGQPTTSPFTFKGAIQSSGPAPDGSQIPQTTGPFTFQGTNAYPQISASAPSTNNPGLAGQDGRLTSLSPSSFVFEEGIYRPLAVPNFIPLVTPGMPAAFNLQAKIGETFEYDDNPLLTTATASALIGSITAPEFLVSGGSPDANLSLDTTLDINEFNLAGYSSQDLHSKFNATIDRQRLLASLKATLDYDTTRTSELNLSGINLVGIRHTGFTISPEIGFRISPIDQFVLDGSLNENDYANTVIYTDFRTYTVRPTYVHSFDPNNSIAAFVGLQKYETLTGVASSIESIMPGLGWNSQITPRLTGSVSAGLNQSRASVGGVSSPTSNGYTYNVNFIYGLAESLDHITATLSHNLTPVSSGIEVTQTSVELSEKHQFTPRFSANISLLYQTNQLPNAGSGEQKTYLSGAAEIDYTLTRSLTFSGTFRYRHRDFFVSRQVAASNALLFSIVFSPNAFTLGL
jgi:hypothetical protein